VVESQEYLAERCHPHHVILNRYALSLDLAQTGNKENHRMNQTNPAAYASDQACLDGVVVGAGPNGLAAAITLARAGRSVHVFEGKDTVGGGARTAELTLPGFKHDICSAIHPLGVGSPFFQDLPLEQFGLEWIFPRFAAAHPLDDGTAVVIQNSIEASAATMGRDAGAYERLMIPLVGNWKKILQDLLGPKPIPPRYPIATGQFGLLALLPAEVLVKLLFRGPRARAVFAGMAAHSMIPLEYAATASFGLMLLLLAHAIGWPMARGGSQAIVNAMAQYLESLGGKITTGMPVTSLDQLPRSRAVLLDITPRQLLTIAGERLPESYSKGMKRFHYGPGVFKVDYALDGPIPWKASACRQAGTVHLGGTFEEISAAERAVWHGEHPERPFVLLAQQSLFDATRAPGGMHTLWAYCHVPNGSQRDMSNAIEEQIERFAPGFRSRILYRHSANAQQMEQYNPNYVGGDINGGAQTIDQFFTRPVASWVPYAIPVKGMYMCSSSTPPGGGVHGMCGFQAAKAVLKGLASPASDAAMAPGKS
jgi:phytoene dehydrogenase-like protein